MNATIDYTLSAVGQRAALAAGLPATADQTAIIEVTPADLDLFSVDSKGQLYANAERGAEFETYDWKRVKFDAPLTTETALGWLRNREAQRAVVLAARAEEDARKKAAAAEKAAAQRQADRFTLQVAVTNADLTGIECYPRENAVRIGDYAIGRTYKTSDTGGDGIAALVGEVLEIHQEQQAKKAAEATAKAALQALIDSIPAAPVIRPTTLQSDGRYALTVPDPNKSGAWAKHVTRVDAAGQDGTAFDGPWLKVGQQTVLAAGDMIVVGAKWTEGSRRNAVTKKQRDLYIVTPAGILSAGGNTAILGAEILAQDPADRVLRAMEAGLKVAEARIAKFVEMSAQPEFVGPGPVFQEFANRRAAWCAREEALKAALEKATAPAPITSVSEAAAAIIAAGYKALAKQYHPDMGGSAEVMALLTDGRNALRDILALANEVPA